MLLKKLHSASLVELVASIMIISISLTSVSLAYFQASHAPSANAMQQALTIASNYFNEILLKNFPTTLPCPAPPANRSNYTNVCDYNNLVNVGARNKNGNVIPGLEKYTVSVNVVTSTAAILGSLTGGATAATASVVRIDVTVTNAGMPNLIMSAYKGKY